ncbi:MAG: FAD-dependent monooxygenase [Nitrospirae bacterium]|nr:FAD-dependent monooxygenase [Nitrospirota bacterium]
MGRRYASDILIVGAGVGGLSLGLRLASKGCRVRILQQREPPPAKRPEMVQPHGLRALAELGLLGRLKAERVARVERFCFSQIQGDPLCRVDYRILDHHHPYALIALPGQTRRALLEGLRDSPTVQIHWGARFTGILRRGRQVIGATAVENGREQEFHALITVGADGSHSRLREALGLPCRIRRYPNAFLGMLVDRPAGLARSFDHQVSYYMGRGEILGIFPCAPAMLCLLYMVPADDARDMHERRLEVLKTRLAEIEPRLKDSLAVLTAPEQVSLLFPAQVRAAKWVVDGAALLGDAAHACHPHVAQGGFQAMEDAKILSEVADVCVRRGNCSARALAPYEEIRRPVVERLQRVANEYVWLWETRNPMLARLRDRIFRNVGERPELLYRVAAIEAGIASGPLTFRERLQALGVCA